MTSKRLSLTDPGAIAQLGERLDRTQEVGGSSPPSSTPRTPAGAGVLAFERSVQVAADRCVSAFLARSLARSRPDRARFSRTSGSDAEPSGDAVCSGRIEARIWVSSPPRSRWSNARPISSRSRRLRRGHRFRGSPWSPAWPTWAMTYGISAPAANIIEMYVRRSVCAVTCLGSGGRPRWARRSLARRTAGLSTRALMLSFVRRLPVRVGRTGCQAPGPFRDARQASRSSSSIGLRSTLRMPASVFASSTLMWP